MTRVHNPVLVQLIPLPEIEKPRGKKGAIFKSADDFARRSPMLRLLAAGSDRDEIRESARGLVVAMIGEEQVERFAIYQSSYPISPDWDEGFLVEDWGADQRRPDIPVIRSLVYAPTPEIAAWQARAAIEDRRKYLDLWHRECEEQGIKPVAVNQIPCFPPPSLGSVTTVHSVSQYSHGIALSPYPWYLQIGAMRRAAAEHLTESEGRERARYIRRVERITSGKSREELIGKIKADDLRRELENDDAEVDRIGAVILCERLLEKAIAEINVANASNEDYLFGFIDDIHHRIYEPISENVILLGSVEPGSRSMLDKTIISGKPLVIEHGGAK
jgi:hypothetical protein